MLLDPTKTTCSYRHERLIRVADKRRALVNGVLNNQRQEPALDAPVVRLLHHRNVRKYSGAEVRHYQQGQER